MIHHDRIKVLNTQPVRTDRHFVIYWMQASQRTEYNHALAYAVQKANELKKPLYVYFGITDNFPEANIRHYCFMLEGLNEVRIVLHEMDIPFVVRYESPETGIAELSHNAAIVITDRGYLRIQKQWRAYAAKKISCTLIQVESDVVVPVETTSKKEEYAARTIRPKIHKTLDDYLVPVSIPDTIIRADEFDIESFKIEDIDAALECLSIDTSVPTVNNFQGGQVQAEKKLDYFLQNGLPVYAGKHSDPNAAAESNLSPYLHFGHISPLHIALEILDSNADPENKGAFLEQLIVRRELSMNFVHYNSHYDSFTGLTDWAKHTLSAHKGDMREHIYTIQELEKAETHDEYWNASQQEMVMTGKMHNYMRMYWGKKIIEWSPDPEEAFKRALYLNNKYELDGRDPNGFTGVAWCFGKHDRPWSERRVFGTTRYMNDKGLKRKFDIEKYVMRINSIFPQSSK
ncbi:deoxyribodipyrimidine photo-lyase [candidate division KSB1 bacterium]